MPAAPDAEAPTASADTAAFAPKSLVEPAETAISGTRPASEAQPSSAVSAGAAPSTPGAPVSLQQLKDAWPEILEAVKNEKTTAWLVVYTAHVLGLNGDVLALSFPSQADVESFKQQKVPGMGTSDFLRTAIVAVLGLRVKFIARVDAARETSSPSASSGDAPAVAAEPAPAAPRAESPQAATTSADAVEPVAPLEPVETVEPLAPVESVESDPEAASPTASATAPTATAPTATAPTAPTTPTAAAATAGAPDPTPRTAPAPAAMREVASSPTAGASPVAASTSGWATVAIPGSPNGPALPAIADDTMNAVSPGTSVTQAHSAPMAPGSSSPVPAQPIETSDATGGGLSDEPWPATSVAPQSSHEPPFDDVPPPFDDDVPPEMDAPADERVPNYETHAAASAGQQRAEPGRQQQPAPGQSNSGQQNSGPRQRPNASGSRGTTKTSSRAPSFAEKQRYGEAVVREILGATFIEEQPYNAAPRTRNDY